MKEQELPEDFVVGRKKIYKLDEIEVLSERLNRPVLQRLSERDFIVFPHVDQTVKMKKVEELHRNGGDGLGEILRHLYYDEGLSSWEIGFEFGISRDTVGAWMGNYGMPLRMKDTNEIAQGITK